MRVNVSNVLLLGYPSQGVRVNVSNVLPRMRGREVNVSTVLLVQRYSL